MESARALLAEDPVGNAVVWDRAFQQPDYEVHVAGTPPKGVIAVHRTGQPTGANFFALHAKDVDSAGVLAEFLPKGFTIIHLTEEFPLALLAPRAAEFNPRPAWLFRLDEKDFVDHPDPRVQPLEPGWAARIAKLWAPDWPAEAYVRRRIEAGPSAAIYAGGEPVAWALTHMVTDCVAIIGFVHVLDKHRRRGLAQAVVAGVAREIMETGKIPALHAYTDNGAALALFPTLGFRKVKRQVWGDAVFR